MINSLLFLDLEMEEGLKEEMANTLGETQKQTVHPRGVEATLLNHQDPNREDTSKEVTVIVHGAIQWQTPRLHGERRRQ